MNAQSKRTHPHSWITLLQRSTQTVKNGYANYLNHRKERLALRQLLQLNDHMLKDMGLTRSDILEVHRRGAAASKRISKSRQLKIKKQKRRQEERLSMLPR